MIIMKRFVINRKLPGQISNAEHHNQYYWPADGQFAKSWAKSRAKRETQGCASEDGQRFWNNIANFALSTFSGALRGVL